MVEVLNEEHRLTAPPQPLDRAQGIHDVLRDATGVTLGDALQAIPGKGLPGCRVNGGNRPQGFVGLDVQPRIPRL